MLVLLFYLGEWQVYISISLVAVFCAVLTNYSSTSHAASTRVLVDYEMGNQINRSGLMILSNGLIMKKQIHMGETTYLDDETLSPDVVKNLIEQIDKAAMGGMVRNDEIPASDGGEYGQAMIFTSDGFRAILYALVANDQEFKKTLVYQSGIEAKLIRGFIQANIRDKMPALESNLCSALLNHD